MLAPDVQPDAVSAVRERLSSVGDEDLCRRGFRDGDRRDALAIIEQVLQDPQGVELVATLAARLWNNVGDFTGARVDDHGGPLEHPAAVHDRWGIGVLPLLAFLVTAPEVAAFHTGRGIEPEISDAALADLGQQSWVHRRTFGAFGLHTYRWLRIAWSGALYWLGRLQFNLIMKEQQWLLSTHIPESGPLHPDLVADAFGQARTFFACHFPDYPTRLFHCDSWLLDPQLADVLAPESNLVWFQQLWRLSSGARNGDADALFFVFHRRGEVDRASLPRDTSLQRAILDQLEAGGHWHACEGVFDQDGFPAVPASGHEPVGDG